MSNSAPTSFLSSTLKSIAQNNAQCAAAVDAVTALALAAADIATVIRHPDKDAALGAERGSANVDGDEQKTLDVLADEMIQAALVKVPAVVGLVVIVGGGGVVYALTAFKVGAVPAGLLRQGNNRNT